MSSLLEALSGAHPDSNKKELATLSGDFSRKVDTFRDSVVNSYLKFKTDLNKSIAEIAVRENLNDDQIQRIVEEVNNQVYLIKYNEMKGSPEREVRFDIASVPKIKSAIKDGDNHKPVNQRTAVKEASEGEAGFEKKASWEDTDGGDSLNFLNYSSYEVGGLNPEVASNRKAFLERKMLEKVAGLESERDALTEKIATDIYTIAEALVKYDRANADVQSIYGDLCKQASLRSADQSAIRDAVIQKVAQMKEYRLVPSEYDLNLNFVDIDKVDNEFSLGQYSLIKKANEITQSNSNIPVIVTDEKTIRSVQDIIDLAGDVTANKQKLSDTKKSLNDTTSKISSFKKVGDGNE
jgi:hypothetical protein